MKKIVPVILLAALLCLPAAACSMERPQDEPAEAAEPAETGESGYTVSAVLTFYDASVGSVTADGTRIWAGMDDPHIVACNWLPLGTVIEIDGVQYTVRDRGGSGLSVYGRIDVFLPDGGAVQAGVQYKTVRVIR